MAVTAIAAPPKDYLKVSDLGPDQLEALLRLAAKMKVRPHAYVEALRGDTLVCFFEKPSTRTRVSFAAAAERLGMLPLLLRPDELQLGRGETIGDTARSLAGYASAIVIRTYAQAIVEAMAEASRVPVINALTDDHHPCQALADVMTLQERFGSLEGLQLAYVGDGNNVANSLIEIAALTGIELVIATPAGREPHANGHLVTDDPREAVRNADAVYTDVWVSMGDDAEREERLRDLAPFQVNAELMALAKPTGVFMHCLPAHRGEEVSADVIDGPQSVVWQQAENRLPTEEALLLALLTKEWDRS